MLVVFYLFPGNYMFRVDGGDAGARLGLCLELTVKTSERRQLKLFWCLYCWLWLYFALCSGVYVVGSEQVNVGWTGNVFLDYCVYVCLFNETF